jgi:WD40 repeat protein
VYFSCPLTPSANGFPSTAPSLHPNGYTLASAGNDGVVNLWDVRKFQGSPHKAGTPKAIASHSIGLSVSSSFFSPSGNSLLSTSFSNKLDLIGDPDKQKGDIKPTVQIPHNNQTGRWLSTFMASWHAKQNIFVCGSMKKPRCVELFDEKGKLLREVSGDSLTAVASRCCFHPSTSRLIVIGGNSSGRLVVIR